MTRNQANSHVHLERSNRPHAYITGYTQNLSPVAHNNPYQTLSPDVNLGRGGEHVPQRAQHVPRAGSQPRGAGLAEQMHQPQNNTQPEQHPDMHYRPARAEGRGAHAPPAPPAPARRKEVRPPGGDDEQSEEDRLEGMTPWKRKTVPHGLTAQAQDGPKPAQRVQGYCPTMQEYEDRCAGAMATGELVWIKICRIQAARVCEVVEHLRHTGDQEGNLWNISLRDAAWLGNIFVSQSGAAWITLIMHQSQFEHLRFIDGAIDLDRGFWQDQMKGMYAEVDHLNGLRGDSLDVLVQVKPGADGGLLSLQQHQDIDTVGL